MASLIKKTQLDPNITDLVGAYGSGYFIPLAYSGNVNALIFNALTGFSGVLTLDGLQGILNITGGSGISVVANTGAKSLVINYTGTPVPNNILYTTGNQFVSDAKTFSTLNVTGLLSGNLANFTTKSNAGNPLTWSVNSQGSFSVSNGSTMLAALSYDDVLKQINYYNVNSLSTVTILDAGGVLFGSYYGERIGIDPYGGLYSTNGNFYLDAGSYFGVSSLVNGQIQFDNYGNVGIGAGGSQGFNGGSFIGLNAVDGSIVGANGAFILGGDGSIIAANGALTINNDGTLDIFNGTAIFDNNQNLNIGLGANDPPGGGSMATPPYLGICTDRTSIDSDPNNSKVFLYNDGEGTINSFSIGPNFDSQYHSFTTHGFYSNGSLVANIDNTGCLSLAGDLIVSGTPTFNNMVASGNTTLNTVSALGDVITFGDIVQFNAAVSFGTPPVSCAGSFSAANISTPSLTVNGTGISSLITGIIGSSVWNTPQPINNQTGTGYSLIIGDAGKLITLNNVSGISLTIPTNTSVAFPIGISIDIAQIGSGRVTITGASTGVTLTNAGGLITRTLGSPATMQKIATNQWLIYGDLLPS